MDEQIKYYENKLKYEIDAWDLHASLKNQDNIIVIDVRSAEAFDCLHIPGAINLPHREMAAVSTAMFAKAALYVTYCDGIGCNGSTRGALNMTRLGFRVKELTGGLAWWLRDGYETAGNNCRSDNDLNCGC